MYYWWDPTYILVVIGAIICLIACKSQNHLCKIFKIPQYVRTDRSTGGGADLTRCRHL